MIWLLVVVGIYLVISYYACYDYFTAESTNKFMIDEYGKDSVDYNQYQNDVESWDQSGFIKRNIVATSFLFLCLISLIFYRD